MCGVGVIVAIPALRLSGIYFALATAAFAITMDNWVFVLPSFNLFGRPYAPFGSGSLVFAPFRIGSLATQLQDVTVHCGISGLRRSWSHSSSPCGVRSSANASWP